MIFFVVSTRMAIVSVMTMMAATAELQEDATTHLFETCPVKSTTAMTSLPIEKYHSDLSCDRSTFNMYKSSLHRHADVARLKVAQRYKQVPVQKTVVCPVHMESLHPQAERNATATDDSNPPERGFDTVWLVENTASTAVVLAFYNVHQNGLESSAVHTDIVPPQADPDAILLPGQWKAVYTYEGHIFHVREYDTVTGTTGRVLLQHRAGLIPITGRLYDGDAKNLTCPTQDAEPVIQRIVTQKDPVTQTVKPVQIKQADPKFHRPVEKKIYSPNRPCNIIDVGFRNLLPCPVNGYFVNPHVPRSPTCPVTERFKLHLGADNLTPSPADFVWSWDSHQKYEGSFVGHTFSFRLAANPQILLDLITLEPTRVQDCPDLKQQQEHVGVTALTTAEHIVTHIALPDTHPQAQQQQNRRTTGTRTMSSNNYNATHSCSYAMYASVGNATVVSHVCRQGANKSSSSSTTSKRHGSRTLLAAVLEGMVSY